MTTTPPAELREYSGLPDAPSLEDDLEWYRVVLTVIKPRLDDPDLWLRAALDVDDPVSAVLVRMIANHNAHKSRAQRLRYVLQMGDRAPAGYAQPRGRLRTRPRLVGPVRLRFADGAEPQQG